MNLRYESKLWRAGYQVVAGVDEAGRGAWAGPIVAAAVACTRKQASAFTHQPWYRFVADSKVLTEAKRERIFKAAGSQVVWATAVVEPSDIDATGIGNANRLVVARALEALPVQPNYAIVDYVAKLGKSLAGVTAQVMVDADAKVFVVALASIFAKVTRDHLMREFGAKYPGYGFAQHKGYGTQAHARSLRKLGVSAIHRRSYRPVAQTIDK